VLARSPGTRGRTPRDVFGWNLPFRRSELEQEIDVLLQRSGQVVEEGGLSRSTVRFSTVGSLLLVHSSHPTDADSSVFLGPDTYRFCMLLETALPPLGRVVDVGCGTGAGGLSIGGRVQQLVLSDVNPLALRFARVNATLAGYEAAEIVQSDVLSAVPGRIDGLVANPPYLVDATARTYRHGGARGIELSERIVREGVDRLRPGGRLVLYTGTPVVDGEDLLRSALDRLLESRFSRYEYRELDPDIWGEELATPAYQDADRIALVSLVGEVR
jgi:release factor glutamine methyltransferase